jgi:hypothetical protein
MKLGQQMELGVRLRRTLRITLIGRKSYTEIDGKFSECFVKFVHHFGYTVLK